MTPPPDGLESDVILEDLGPDQFVARCPLWTTGGRSGWEMAVAGERRASGFPHEVVTRLTHRASGEVLDAASAPCPARQGLGWADDASFVPEVWPGPPGDPRIPRGAFVGMSYGIRFHQILGGVHAVFAFPIDLRLLNPGQSAILVLDSTFTVLYGDGLPAVYDQMWPPDFESDVVEVCQRIGAHAYAEVFGRVRDLLPSDARGSWDARRDHVNTLYGGEQEDPRWQAAEREIGALEDAGDLIWHRMLRYVDAHPAEFFLDH